MTLYHAPSTKYHSFPACKSSKPCTPCSHAPKPCFSLSHLSCLSLCLSLCVCHSLQHASFIALLYVDHTSSPSYMITQQVHMTHVTHMQWVISAYDSWLVIWLVTIMFSLHTSLFSQFLFPYIATSSCTKVMRYLMSHSGWLTAGDSQLVTHSQSCSESRCL